MFGDLMGNLQGMQAKVQAELAELEVKGDAGNGMVVVTATADKQIRNISINPEVVNASDIEELEDLLLIAMNRALDEAEKVASSKMQGMMSGMMPPGMFG